MAFRDLAARFRLRSAVVWRDTSARLRLRSSNVVRDGTARLALRSLAYRHTSGRFNVRETIAVQAGGADSPVVLAFRPALAVGDLFDNRERTLLAVRNTSGGPVTVTVSAGRACSLGTKHDSVVVVASGATVYIGPFDTTRFNDANGRVQVGYSAVAGITVAATRLVG